MVKIFILFIMFPNLSSNASLDLKKSDHVTKVVARFITNDVNIMGFPLHLVLKIQICKYIRLYIFTADSEIICVQLCFIDKMASVANAEELDAVTCSVCKDVYKNPVKISCDHT